MDTSDNLTRYSPQTAFAKLGIDGQKKLLRSRAVVMGMGALGTMAAERLCRAGLGFLRLIDRDIVDITNLHRQTLYNEGDAYQKKPKAIAAAEHLAKINSTISLQPLSVDVKKSNIEELVLDADIVLDGSDNFELRFLINTICTKFRIPWVYGGVTAASGAFMSIIPGGPCFRCLYPYLQKPGIQDFGVNNGVMNMITGIIACMEAAEAVKILTYPQAVSKNYTSINLWENSIDYLTIHKNQNCPDCGKQAKFASTDSHITNKERKC
jgi:adenylyltransferase/sulfurtransferase